MLSQFSVVDGADTYHVVNELRVKAPPEVITVHTYFKRVPDDDDDDD